MQLSPSRYFWVSHVVVHGDITSFTPLFLYLISSGFYWCILEILSSQQTSVLLRSLLPVPMVTASKAWSPGDVKAMPCSASLTFWAIFHEGLSKWYWLLLSYLRGFCGKQLFFFILFSQLSPFPGRDMSPEGAELAIKTRSNTTAYLVSAFPSDALFSYFLWDEF